MAESKRNFKPWVGPKYNTNENMFGCKLMVMGLSFYSHMCGTNCPYDRNCSNNDCTGWAEEAKNEDNVRAYEKFVSIVAPASTVQEVWDNIIFTNYLQIGVSVWNEIHRECYSDAEIAFFETLNQYKPEKLISWGAELRDYGPGQLWTWRHSKSEPYTGFYTLSDGTIVETFCMPHPSAVKSNECWLQVSEMLKKWMKRPDLFNDQLIYSHTV